MTDAVRLKFLARGGALRFDLHMLVSRSVLHRLRTVGQLCSEALGEGAD